jgi:hypothetical protein
MARTSGIIIEKDVNGKARFARIDLRKYADELKKFFNDKGVVIDEIQLTSKMKRSINQAKKGEVKSGNPENIWE